MTPADAASRCIVLLPPAAADDDDDAAADDDDAAADDDDAVGDDIANWDTEDTVTCDGRILAGKDTAASAVTKACTYTALLAFHWAAVTPTICC